MTKPIPLEILESEFDDSKEVWVLRDKKSADYVIVPDDRFPGRRPVRFFLRKQDAEALLVEIRRENRVLARRNIAAVKVKLLPSARVIAEDTNPSHADSFVVHSPNEVLEFLRDKAAKRN
jgi:hypothetical protein